jgi:hypothetical protein
MDRLERCVVRGVRVEPLRLLLEAISGPSRNDLSGTTLNGRSLNKVEVIMVREGPAQRPPPPKEPYPAEKARSGEITLKTKSERAIFIAGLSLGLLVAFLVALIAI